MDYITPFMCIKSRDKLVAKVFVVYPCNTTQQYRIAHAWYFTYYTTYFFLNFPENVHITKLCMLNDGHGIFGVIFLWRVGSTSHFCPFLRKKRNHCCIDPRIKCWHAVLIVQSTYIGSLNGFRLNYSSLLCIYLKRKETYNKFFLSAFFPRFYSYHA